MDLTDKEIRSIIKNSIQEILMEAQSIATKYREEFELIAHRLKRAISKVKSLEEIHSRGYEDESGEPLPTPEVQFSERFLIFCEQLYEELYGDIFNPIDNEELNTMELDENLALFYFALKLRMDLIEESEQEKDEDEMVPRNKIFFSQEYEALSDLVYNLSEAQMSLENFLVNVNSVAFVELLDFFKSFRTAQGKFFSFYVENKPRYESIIKKAEEKGPMYRNIRSYAQKTEKKEFPRVEKHRNYPME